jgi:hypothetical protein
LASDACACSNRHRALRRRACARAAHARPEHLGYQKGGALTVAGLATLLTNALPIAAGTVVLGEPVPSGVFGGVRTLAFAAVTLGAILLARPDPTPGDLGGTTPTVQTSGAVPKA